MYRNFEDIVRLMLDISRGEKEKLLNLAYTDQGLIALANGWLSFDILQQWQQGIRPEIFDLQLNDTLVVILKNNNRGIEAMDSGLLLPADIGKFLGRPQVLDLLVSDRGRELMAAGAIDIKTSEGRSKLFGVEPRVLEALLIDDHYFTALKEGRLELRQAAKEYATIEAEVPDFSSMGSMHRYGSF